MSAWNQIGRGNVAGVMRVRLAALLVLVGALAGCAGGGADKTPASSPASSRSAAESRPALAVPSLPPSQSPKLVPPPSSGSEITIKGTLQEGVEGNCVLLKTPDRLYQLIGGDRSKLQGSTSSTVTVTGRVVIGMMTTCQQGTPFQVTDVRPG
jgi:hypothetical protein